MKLHLVFLPVCLSLASLTAAATPNSPDQDDVEEMMAALSRSSPCDFLRAVSSSGWVAPVIRSKWYVDHSEDRDAHQVTVRNRIFGRAFAARLDDWAAEVLDTASSGKCEASELALLSLADWLASSEGYGNLLLASRCQDIAAVGIGRLVVDLRAPLINVSRLMSGLDAAWSSPHVRARVLDAEAGATLFDVSGLLEAEAEKSLQETWRNGCLLQIEHSSPGMKAAFEGHANAKGAVLSTAVQEMFVRLRPRESAILLQNLPFFADDPYSALPRPVTLLSSWDAKRHERLVIGFGSHNAANLKALLVFRSIVGAFPKSREEFKAAWLPHITGPDQRVDRESFDTYASAWQAYEEITAGEFVDGDTRERRLAAQLKARPDPSRR